MRAEAHQAREDKYVGDPLVVTLGRHAVIKHAVAHVVQLVDFIIFKLQELEGGGRH